MRRSERDADLKQPSQPKKSKQNKTNEEGDNQRNDSINDQSKEYGIQHMYKCRERKREEREVIISSGNNSQIDGERRRFKRLLLVPTDLQNQRHEVGSLDFYATDGWVTCGCYRC